MGGLNPSIANNSGSNPDTCIFAQEVKHVLKQGVAGLKDDISRIIGIAFVLSVCMLLLTTIWPQYNLAYSDNNPQSNPYNSGDKTFTYAIETGWSLISIPYIPSNDSIEKVFSSINGNYDAIYGYNNANPMDPWKAYYPYKPTNRSDLLKVNNRMGLWIHITNASGITISGNGSVPISTNIGLTRGWNLIGYPSVTNRTVNDLFIGISQSISHEAFRFDVSQPHMLKKMANTEVFHMGLGYWVYVSSSCQLKINWQ
jgi:hypothetical protein